MFMLIAILVIQVDARCGVTEGVVQCRDWREIEGGNYVMTNVLILERAIGEIHIEDYPALTRLIIHDQQASCNDISANPWTTVRIGSLTCQNAQDISEPKDVAMTTLRTVELAAFTFKAMKYSCEPPHLPQSCQRPNQRHSDAQPGRGAHPSDCHIDLFL
ncbi:uncharacterized protein LOC134234284 [Saccostrea cucullata]|uniref:uncharacterized protein LOC134234284 n=1 Tax=Saccostrea cuccullata TaxID=36930 RepID=UPI002ED5E9D1